MPDWACLVGAGTADSRAGLAPTGTISRTNSADAASPASPSRMRLIQKLLVVVRGQWLESKQLPFEDRSLEPKRIGTTTAGDNMPAGQPRCMSLRGKSAKVFAPASVTTNDSLITRP